jgi:branched-chain amino acid transport system ATP-binding protein
VSETLLSTQGLGRRFGGLVAVADVSLELRRGELHALLGPNGAGKSTFINLLSGDIAPSTGSVSLRGRDVTRLPPERRSQLGIGRSYQRTSVFLDLSVHENVRLAAQAHLPLGVNPFADADARPALAEATRAALEAAGLSAGDRRRTSVLSHGERRQLEIAMMLATGPEVLLLDEPLAGMGAEEAARVVELLRGLVPGRAVLLVEHDMDAVFALADVITVMVNGKVLETGRPEAIRASPAVQQAYLGDAAAAPGGSAP